MKQKKDLQKQGNLLCVAGENLKKTGEMNRCIMIL